MANRRRALFVLAKIEEILAWEQNTERERNMPPLTSTELVLEAARIQAHNGASIRPQSCGLTGALLAS